MRGPLHSAVVCSLLLVSCAESPHASEDGTGGANVAGASQGGGGSGSSGAGSGGAAPSSGGSAGTTTSGGAASAGSGNGGTMPTGGSGGTTPVTVGNCDALAPAGTWQQITPPDILQYLPPDGLGSPNGALPFGVQAIGLDPTTDGTLYLGTCSMGVWKTTDCGSSWARINTGNNGNTIDQGAQTTLVVDPVDNQIIYTNSFYGQNGAFKSTDGGVNWAQFWPPADPDLSNVVQYNFVSYVIMDPWDHEHLLVSFHSSCAPPHTAACIAETTDSGESWSFIDGDPSWAGDEGQAVYFLDSSQTLLFGSQSNGLWRTTNGGDSWQAIEGSEVSHGLGQLYRASNGAFYVGVANGMQRSADGSQWSLIPNSGHGVPTTGVVGDGTHLYSSDGFPWAPGGGPGPYQPFFTALESDGLAWSPMASPAMVDANVLAYDHSHHILYSSNYYAGFFRVVTE